MTGMHPVFPPNFVRSHPIYLGAIGIDLGESYDYAALAVVEQGLWAGSAELDPAFDGYALRLGVDEYIAEPGWVRPGDLPYKIASELAFGNLVYGRPAYAPLYVTHCVRFKQPADPEVIKAHLREVLNSERYKNKWFKVLADASGGGELFVRQMRSEGLPVASVKFTTGESMSIRRGGYNVAKSVLVGTTRQVAYAGQLFFSPRLANAEEIRTELRNYTGVQNRRTGNISYGTPERQGLHDDQVTSVSLPVWFLRAMWYREYDDRFKQIERFGRPPVGGIGGGDQFADTFRRKTKRRKKGVYR